MTCCRILKTGRSNLIQSRLRTYPPNFKNFQPQTARRRSQNDSLSAVRSENKFSRFPSSAPNTSPRNRRNARAERKTVSMWRSPQPYASSSRKRELDRLALHRESLCLCGQESFEKTTTETQRTQRLHREEPPFSNKAR